MIIVDLKGGLGNQMFQYALYKSFQMRGIDARLDTTHIGREMERLNRCTIFDSFILDKKHKIHRKVGNIVAKYITVPIYRKLCGSYSEKRVGTFDEKIFDVRNGYISGYWQTEKYFANCRSEIVQSFALKSALSKESHEALNKIELEENSVSIHIRLGDYTSPDNQKIFGNICTKEYYKRAIEYVKSVHNDAKFFVFSNDASGAKEVLGENNFEIINVNDDKTAYMDLFLMSKCKHNIIANSSFSWWGAWLNEYTKKIVIAPAKWMNVREMPDICPKDWIRL